MNLNHYDQRPGLFYLSVGRISEPAAYAAATDYLDRTGNVYRGYDRSAIDVAISAANSHAQPWRLFLDWVCIADSEVQS